jgi:hypothetical protein
LGARHEQTTDQAWGLIQASLQQAGCGGNGFSVREMKSISSGIMRPSVKLDRQAAFSRSKAVEERSCVARIGEMQA